MSTYRSRTDQRTADDTEVDRHLMCSAHGCPNRWTTTQGGNLCRWHADSERHRWPQITQEQQEAETDRALYAGMDRPQKESAPMSAAQKRAINERMTRALDAARKNPRAWIDRLLAKEAAHIPLSAAQKHALACVRTPLSGEPL